MKLLGIGLIMAFSLATATQGIILEEDWNDNVIDTGTWTYAAGNGHMQLEDPCSNGDYALSMAAPLDWTAYIYTKDSFNRADNIYCEFTIWGDNTRTSAGQTYPGAGGWCGGWQDPALGGGQFWNVNEATLGKYWNDLALEETGGHGIGPRVPLPNLNTAITSSLSKETAIRVRITLGVVSGAMLQWKGINDLTWNAEVADTLGTGTSVRPAAILGFAPVQSYVFVDDILVDYVPEPMTMALLGLGGLAVLRRRKRA